MKWICVSGFLGSVCIHFGLFMNTQESGSVSVPEDSVNQDQRSEIAAVSAFQALDNARLVDGVAQALSTDLPSLETPEIALPKAAPPLARPENIGIARPPKKAPAQNIQSSNSNSSESQKSSGQNTAPTQSRQSNQNANAPSSSGPSAAQQADAKQRFGAGVRQALYQKFRRPSGVRGRVVIRITFRNGRAASVGLANSSGNVSLDRAALDAAKTARYPSAPSALPNSVSYNLPISVN